VRRAAVLGTGSMAPEIAAALAAAGLDVALVGRDPERAAGARDRALGLLGRRPGEIAAAEITAPVVAEADLVVETIVEDVDAKRRLLGRVEWHAPEAVLATNTSSLRIADLAVALRRPERFAGLHFLKPAHLTAVVEVIPGPATSPQAVDALTALAAAMGKAPLVVRDDVPGFIWNRIQFAVLRECLHMLEAGVADAADIDAAVSDGLAPRWMAAGPLATADLGGLGTFARISAELFPHLASGPDVPAELTRRAAEGSALQPWVQRRRAEVDALRARALETGRRIADERRRLAG